jgi:hypothetical protein
MKYEGASEQRASVVHDKSPISRCVSLAFSLMEMTRMDGQALNSSTEISVAAFRNLYNQVRWKF